MLSVETPFYRPKDKQAQADMKKAKFFQVGTVVARGGVGGGRLSVKCVCVDGEGGWVRPVLPGWLASLVRFSQSAPCSSTPSHPIRNHDAWFLSVCSLLTHLIPPHTHQSRRCRSRGTT